MAGTVINIPSKGSPSWKAPVATAAALPATGNSPGDARAAIDTGIIYVWDGASWQSSAGAMSDSFTTIQTPAGTAPVATSPTDTLTFTSTGNTITITGDSSTDTINFETTTTNSGDVTLAPVGSSPNGNAASLSVQVLTLQPADATNPGVVTALAQTFGGAKTFASTIAASNFSGSSSGTNTGDVTLGATATSGGLTLAGQVLSAAQSTTSTNGWLSSTDWNTFNGKQSTVTIGALDAQAANANGLALVANVLSSQSADATHPGMVNITTQSFAGNKTFTGTISASNLSGTNTGDITLAAFGSTPNSNGASLSGQALTLQPADGSNPGGVSTTTQTFAGNKTFSGTVAISPSSTSALTVNSTSFVVDSTNNAIGVGMAPATTTVIDILNNSGSIKAIQATSYGSNIGYRARRSNGTLASPTNLVANDNMSFFSARGYGATGFAAASTGALNIIAGETFTDSSMLTYATINVTPTGSVTSAEAFRVASTGVTIGPQSSSTAVHFISGGVIKTTRTITGNLTLDTTTKDYVIFVTTASGAISITLPPPVNGRVFIFKDISGSANTNNITIVRNGSEKIEGLAASKVLQTNWGSWTITSNGTDWFFI